MTDSLGAKNRQLITQARSFLLFFYWQGKETWRSTEKQWSAAEIKGLKLFGKCVLCGLGLWGGVRRGLGELKFWRRGLFLLFQTLAECDSLLCLELASRWKSSHKVDEATGRMWFYVFAYVCVICTLFFHSAFCLFNVSLWESRNQAGEPLNPC